LLCVDAVPATAATVADRLVVGVEVVDAVADVADAGACVAVDVVVVVAPTAMQPVSATRLTMLIEPAILRARRAGCGRRLGVPGVDIRILLGLRLLYEHQHRRRP
jgi:hypothetical protein